MIYNNLYLDEINIFSKAINSEYFDNKSIMLSGATGLIGSYLVDTLLINPALNVKIISLVRSVERANDRFAIFANDSRLKIIHANLYNSINYDDEIDYLIHAASHADPATYAKYPIDTIMLNVAGLKNMLDLSVKSNVKRSVFMSSCEVYGESDVDKISEEYCGYINCLDFRSGYNESKRAGEALCASYIKEYGLDIVLPRLSRTYGPTMKLEDSKALSQFIKNAVNNQDIVLKSKGEQEYSYAYVSDAVSGILYLLEKSEKGNAYNISGEDVLQLNKVANIAANAIGRKVIYELPSETEKIGYSKVTRSVFDLTKIKALGWKPTVSLKDGIERTIYMLRERVRGLSWT